MSEITVSVDDRARLVMAVLAGSNWPEMEQAQLTHAVHPHSKLTRHFVSQFNDHTAVTLTNAALAQGIPLSDMFTAALRSTWPALEPAESLPDSLSDQAWLTALSHFARFTRLDAFWQENQALWQESEQDLIRIFQNCKLSEFIDQLMGYPVQKRTIFVPCLVYPMLNPVFADTAEGLYLILPPAKAYGESAPWPYGEDPGWVLTQSSWYLTSYFLADKLRQMDETQQNLLRHAAVTLCLEMEFDEAEAMSYLVRTKKQHKLPALPNTVETLRAYLQSPNRSIEDLRI